MDGKKALIEGLSEGTILPVEVESIEICTPLPKSRREPIVPDNGKIVSAYPDLTPTNKVVRWRHLSEPENSVQSGHIWLEPDGTPVVVHGACFGIFGFEDILIVDEENSILE